MVWPWTAGFPSIYSTLTVEQISGHPNFRAAKAGDREAAARLVFDLADRNLMHEVGIKYPSSALIVVANPDQQGNQIPNAFAALFSRVSGLDLESGVVKVNHPGHTARGAAFRFAHRAQFDGRLQRGRSYVLLDDVATQGGTISELRQWVYRHQAAVVAVATLGYTPSRKMSNGLTIAPSKDTLGLLHKKHGLPNVATMLGGLGIYEGNAYCLTESEALFIARAPNLQSFVQQIHEEQRSAGDMPKVLSPTPRPTGLAHEGHERK